MPRKHIIVSGRVQGVGFRYHANNLAQVLRLTGWVRNLVNGDVELEIQGPEANLDQYLQMLGRRSAFIRIDLMETEDEPEIHESSFEIRQDE